MNINSMWPIDEQRNLDKINIFHNKGELLIQTKEVVLDNRQFIIRRYCLIYRFVSRDKMKVRRRLYTKMKLTQHNYYHS
jgi:hypothetical protein